MKRHLPCTFLLAIISNFGWLLAQTVTPSWAVLPSNTSPNSITADPAGNIYVANNNSTVTKIASDGTVTAGWAVLPGSSIRRGVVTDASGNVYTTNYGDGSVSKITAGGEVMEAWATLGASPTSMTIDGSGNVYTVNIGNSTVSKVTPDGVVTPVWATLAAHTLPWSIIADGAGNLYTSNTATNTISKITPAGVVTQTWATVASGTYISSNTFDASGNLYTINSLDGTISKITPDGVVTQTWSSVGSEAVPSFMIKDKEGNFYTANGNNTVSKITPAGVVIPAWATLPAGAGPQALVFDAAGSLYTLNTGNNTVSKIQPPIHPDGNGIIYVDSSAAAGGDGSSWATAVPELSDALHYARTYAAAWETTGLQIYVAKGTYLPQYSASDNTLAVGDRNDAFVMVKNVQLSGGFSSGGGTRNWAVNPTVLSGDIGAPDDSSDNAYHVVISAGDLGEGSLDGFTITGGNATGTGTISVNGRTAERIAGGGVYLLSSAPRLTHVKILGNAAQSGGGIYINGSNPVIINTLIAGNAAGNGGGVRLFNCVYAPSLLNVTITGNTAQTGGGIANGSSALNVFNSILFANTATTGKEISNSASQGNSYQFCLIESSNGWNSSWGFNFGSCVVTSDTPFVNAAGGNYQLTSAAGAINSAYDSFYSDFEPDIASAEDLAGNPRVYNLSSGGRIDMGAYEFQEGGALPVKTSPLSGILNNEGQVILSWHTYSELNNKGFQVQYGADGAHFENGLFVPSKAANGNSSAPLDYTVNAGILTGDKYYRIKQMDLNGDTTYSNIIHIAGSGTGFRLNVYPNPAHEFITMHLTGAVSPKGQVLIIDLSGRVVRRQQIIGAAATMDLKIGLSGLPAGVYILKYADGLHDSSVKFIKK